MKNEDDSDTNCNYCAWNYPQKIGKGTGRLGNKRTRPSKYSIIKIDQNTEKSPKDFRRLAVTQSSVEDHQLALVWKTLKGELKSQRNVRMKLIMIGEVGTVPKCLKKKFGNQKNRDHPNYSSAKIIKNTENSLGDRRRFSVIQIPVQNYQ